MSQIKGEKWTLFLNKQCLLASEPPGVFLQAIHLLLAFIQDMFFCLPMEYFAIGGYYKKIIPRNSAHEAPVHFAVTCFWTDNSTYTHRVPLGRICGGTGLMPMCCIMYAVGCVSVTSDGS